MVILVYTNGILMTKNHLRWGDNCFIQTTKEQQLNQWNVVLWKKANHQMKLMPTKYKEYHWKLVGALLPKEQYCCHCYPGS